MKRTFIFFILFLTIQAHSQIDFRAGLLPTINFNSKIGNRIKLNFKTESRINFYNSLGQARSWELSDFSLIGATKLSSTTNVAAGYLIRIQSGAFTHRTIQQLTLVSQFPIKTAHRFMLDQTFGNNQFPEFRVRYRLGTEIPLSGASLNNNEFYFKISNEYIYSIENTISDLGIRLGPFIGYSISTKNKLEIGLDQRFEGLISSANQHRSWISLNWYYSF